MLTKAYKAHESTLNLTLPCTDYILALFEHYKEDHKDNPTFTTMFNSNQKKINKYYKLLDKSLVYIAAIVLYLGYKWKQLEKHQKPEQVSPIKERIKTFQETKYKLVSLTSITPLTAHLSSAPPQASNNFLKWLNKDKDKDPATDKYT